MSMHACNTCTRPPCKPRAPAPPLRPIPPRLASRRWLCLTLPSTRPCPQSPSCMRCHTNSTWSAPSGGGWADFIVGQFLPAQRCLYLLLAGWRRLPASRLPASRLPASRLPSAPTSLLSVCSAPPPMQLRLPRHQLQVLDSPGVGAAPGWRSIAPPCTAWYCTYATGHGIPPVSAAVPCS